MAAGNSLMLLNVELLYMSVHDAVLRLVDVSHVPTVKRGCKVN